VIRRDFVLKSDSCETSAGSSGIPKSSWLTQIIPPASAPSRSHPTKIESMGKLRYIGSKARLTSQIVSVLGKPLARQRFVDLFAGTGVVSRAAADAGWNILANDHLAAATVLTSARLMSRTEVPFKKTGGYSATLEHLNNLAPLEGFFFREYSPVGLNSAGTPRPYFSEHNAKRIDALRAEIKRFRILHQITANEHTLLLADLMEATNQVANIAGTYGCFLKKLTPSAQRHIHLSVRTLPTVTHPWHATIEDVFAVKMEVPDVVYLDPPYTKRHYGAYYHILETIAQEDEPVVNGVTGLRPWQEKASPFCYKTKAAAAFHQLIAQIKAHRILISYSSDGHVSLEQLSSIIDKHGKATIHKIPGFGRYAPNEQSRKNSATINLVEYIFDLKRD
jgi:adenine-specific DNA-methyltransferase